MYSHNSTNGQKYILRNTVLGREGVDLICSNLTYSPKSDFGHQSSASVLFPLSAFEFPHPNRAGTPVVAL